MARMPDYSTVTPPVPETLNLSRRDFTGETDYTVSSGGTEQVWIGMSQPKETLTIPGMRDRMQRNGSLSSDISSGYTESVGAIGRNADVEWLWTTEPIASLVLNLVLNVLLR